MLNAKQGHIFFEKASGLEANSRFRAIAGKENPRHRAKSKAEAMVKSESRFYNKIGNWNNNSG